MTKTCIYFATVIMIHTTVSLAAANNTTSRLLNETKEEYTVGNRAKKIYVHIDTKMAQYIDSGDCDWIKNVKMPAKMITYLNDICIDETTTSKNETKPQQNRQIPITSSTVNHRCEWVRHVPIPSRVTYILYRDCCELTGSCDPNQYTTTLLPPE